MRSMDTKPSNEMQGQLWIRTKHWWNYGLQKLSGMIIIYVSLGSGLIRIGETTEEKNSHSVTWRFIMQGGQYSARTNMYYNRIQEKCVWYNLGAIVSYYNSSSVCLCVCGFVCLCVPYLLLGPLTDLRQTWWVYVGGPPICPWGVLFRKGQRVNGSTGHFRFPLYYIGASLTPHSCKRRLLLCWLSCRV